jgi:translocation and assembly module TamA
MKAKKPGTCAPAIAAGLRLGPTYWILLAVIWVSVCPAADAPARVEVTIEGITGELLQNVLAFLTLERQKSHPDLTEAWIQNAHEKAAEEIRTALQPFGYYRPQIESSLTREGSIFRAFYRIGPGPPMRLSEVDVVLRGEGSLFPAMRTVIERFPLKQGDPLRHAAYDRLKTELQTAATENGFFDARFLRREIVVNLVDYAAQIHLHFDTGIRYQLGAVRFSDVELKPEFLRRFVGFKPGEPYQSYKLLGLQKALLETGYFSRVVVDPQPDQAQNRQVPVQVTLALAPENKYQAGVGYGTDTGVRLSLGYQDRYINRRGHNFRSTLRLSPIRQTLDAIYAIPLQNPRREQLNFTAVLNRENTRAGRSESGRAGVQRTGFRWGMNEILSLNFLHEVFNISGAEQTANLLMPGVSWSLIRSDDTALYARNGYRLDLSLAGAWSGVVSDVSLLQLRLNGKWIKSLGEKNRLITRGQFGAVETSDFDRLPLTLRFYTGGDITVRGYSYNAISPRNARREETGGRYLTIGSLEYERTLFGNWGAAVFYDAGNASMNIGGEMKQGAGIGVRWRSPVGLVRLDFATAVSQPDHPFHIHLVLGPDL